MLASPAPRGGRQCVDPDLKVLALAQEVGVAVGHRAEVPPGAAQRRETLDLGTPYLPVLCHA